MLNKDTRFLTAGSFEIGPTDSIITLFMCFLGNFPEAPAHEYPFGMISMAWWPVRKEQAGGWYDNMHHSISFRCLISIYCTLTRSYEDFVLAHVPGLSLLNDRHTTGTDRSLTKYVSNKGIQIANRYETNIQPFVIWGTKLAVTTLMLGRPLWKRERDVWARTGSIPGGCHPVTSLQRRAWRC